MKTNNPIPSHLELVHLALKKHLNNESIVVDATCGNGKDSLYILRNFSPQKLYCFDIQNQAIKNTTTLLQEHNINTADIHFINDCHSKIDLYVKESPNIILYNLGYLPGSDKRITTEKNTTLESLRKAFQMIKPNGLISITCYPGHEEGKEEQIAIFSVIQWLDPALWSVYTYNALYDKTPSIVFISKRR